MKSRKLWLFRLYTYTSWIVIFLTLLVFVIGWFYTEKTNESLRILMISFIIFQMAICIVINNPVSKKYRSLIRDIAMVRTRFYAADSKKSPNAILNDMLNMMALDIKAITVQVSIVLVFEVFAFIVMLQGWYYAWILPAYPWFFHNIPIILSEIGMAVLNVVLFGSIMILAAFVKDLKDDVLKEVERIRSTNIIHGSTKQK